MFCFVFYFRPTTSTSNETSHDITLFNARLSETEMSSPPKLLLAQLTNAVEPPYKMHFPNETNQKSLAVLQTVLLNRS